MTEPAPRPMRVGELALLQSGQEAFLFAQNRDSVSRFCAFISSFWPDLTIPPPLFWCAERVTKGDTVRLYPAISTEEIGNLQRGNENSPGRNEIKLRKNEIKLRKNEMKLPKNFSFPPWKISNPSLENKKSPGRNYSEIRIYNIHNTIQITRREALCKDARECLAGGRPSPLKPRVL